MKYTDGQTAHLGDIVALAGQQGIVVCDIDGADYDEALDYSEPEWSYLGHGIMAKFAAFGPIHYTEPEPDLVLIGRGRVAPLINQITAAFASRPRPAIVAETIRPDITDREDAERVGVYPREFLDWSFLQQHADALYAMTGEAFRYYLPMFLILSLQNRQVTPLFATPVIMMLSPGPDRSYWDARFKDLWLAMTAAEYDAVRAWLMAVAETDGLGFDSVELGRAFDTISLLETSGGDSDAHAPLPPNAARRGA